MAESSLPKGSRLAAGRERARTLYKSHRLRKTLLILLAIVVLFGLLGFFATPPLLKSQLETRASAALQRPVTLGGVHINPFTLRVELDRLHIGERDGKTPFVDVDKIVVNASWSSLFRRAPILDELSLQHPQLHLVRTADQKYNFYDLVERFMTRPAAPDEPPTRYALSNISIHNGDIQFKDAVHDVDHRVDQLELGVPFIANLPSDTDIFVLPLLSMRVDGSPIHIESKAKPFAAVRDSATHFKFDKLDLPRYLAYAPFAMPVAVKRGLLSGDLELHFLMSKPAPQMQLTGTLTMDDFVVTASKDAPLLELGHGTIALTQVEPLISRHHFGAIDLQRATLHYTRMAGGHSNFDALTGGASAPAKPDEPATQIRIDAVTLQGSRIDYQDLSGKAPAGLSLDDIHGNLRGLSTVAGPAGSMDLTAGLSGGSLAASGKLDLAKSNYTGKIGLKKVALSPLLLLAPPMMNADVSGGTIDADGQVQATWSPTLNVHLEPATVSLEDFALASHGGKVTPVAWKTLKAEIASYDMAGSEAHLNHLTLSGLKLDVKRLRNGTIDLTGLMLPPVKGAPATPAFRWSVAHLGLDDGAVTFLDTSIEGRPNPVKLTADKFGIDDLSNDMRKPLKLDLNGSLGKGGAFAVTGTVRPEPVNADLKIKASRLDLVPLVPLITVPLNVHIVSAQLALNGRLRYTDRGSAPANIDYRGQATLGRVRVQDKVSGDDFLHWTSLSASGTELRMGEGAPHVSVGGLALDDFYARVIVNANGRMNLQDVVANQTQAPVSVTRTQDGSTPKPATPASAPVPPAPPVDTGPKPEIQIGQITLTRGQLNYTDNFIKPNYTANVTQLTGKIGAFGTAGSGPPADLTLQGQLDDNAPVTIDGTINPLAPVAFLDVKAKADGVELTHLSPYSGKYAGYPITKGRLTADVHYLLDQGKLTADNHIFIDQLTFGDRLEGPGISHLPVKLAVALLKNSQGQIDVHVPVSGSLDDPQFSMGGLIWRAIGNLIMRAVTSPFRLLASAGGSDKDLGYVAFAPGSAVLDTEAQSRLTDIAKVLNDKQSLNLDIIGRIDPAKDEIGLRQVMVQDLVVREKMDDEGDSKDADPTAVKVDPAEYDKYLEKAYKHTKFPKPRNFVGLAKSVPSDEMKSMLETNMPVDQDALRHLAERRADAVRQWLRGKVDDKRIFVLAPKLDAKGIDDEGKTTRVDFGLH
ncbi:uncharacterized protein DUF748 [Luteibacter rhizovicinus]|uniref:Uncharacterized protein DUF748 n=1 Tax=Luteibacter rhizovicinus TaxID=242606 RepID=A0A4R3YU22_9GAMM|nr:DUF748 domain-containing protein [Luteibacter rhizovicinus]TCV94844.1 uncharacterized protein DUF748 [Luteibacter rhizovicinus]